MRKTISAKKRFKVAYRDNFTCQFCGAKPGSENIEIDHLIPLSMYGSDNDENLIATCQKCNRNKSNLVAFPKSMCEGTDTLDEEWTIHRSFGEWRVLFHPELLPVVEYTPYEYWISADRAHDSFWEWHIMEKEWPEPHKNIDFIHALTYFRRLTRSN